MYFPCTWILNGRYTLQSFTLVHVNKARVVRPPIYTLPWAPKMYFSCRYHSNGPEYSPGPYYTPYTQWRSKGSLSGAWDKQMLRCSPIYSATAYDISSVECCAHCTVILNCQHLTGFKLVTECKTERQKTNLQLRPCVDCVAFECFFYFSFLIFICT